MAKFEKIINGPVVQHAEKIVAPLEKYTKQIDGPVYCNWQKKQWPCLSIGLKWSMVLLQISWSSIPLSVDRLLVWSTVSWRYGAILMVKNVAGTNGPDILLANVTILGTIYLHILHFSQHLDTHGFQKCVSSRPFILAMFLHLIKKTLRLLIFFNILWSKSAQN